MDRNTPLYDPLLSVRERAEWLVSQLTTEEKFAWFTLRIRNDRLGIAVSTCGGEGAHGVQARAESVPAPGRGPVYRRQPAEHPADLPVRKEILSAGRMTLTGTVRKRALER